MNQTNCPWCKKMEIRLEQAMLIADYSVQLLLLAIHSSNNLTKEQKDDFQAKWRALKDQT
jgi:predicted DsbA family dithiol-disulfide isomerase